MTTPPMTAGTSTTTFLRGDAFNLPLRDRSVAVIIADPPYQPKAHNKRGSGYKATGYVGFSSREWWPEAMRVLQPGGHLYIMDAIKYLEEWLRLYPGPDDILAWYAPNAASIAAQWCRPRGGRAPSWRPILHYQKPPKARLRWPAHFSMGNVIVAPMIQSIMREAQPYPNQLPLALIRAILDPHPGPGPVLDLFTGTGTTAAVCRERGIECIAIDRNPQALKLARARTGTYMLPFAEVR